LRTERNSRGSLLHETAIISEHAVIGEKVEVGPFSLIGPHAQIGDYSTIGSHCIIEKNTKIGKNSKILSHASIGLEPQDLSYEDSNSRVIIGNRVIVREFCSIQKATQKDSFTLVGDDCFLMNYVHIAHDCKIGNNVIIANSTSLGGYVQIDSFSNLSAQVLVHQFSKIGKYCMIAGGSAISKDIPSYLVSANGKLVSPNLVGLRRNSFSEEQIKLISRAYKTLKKEEKEKALLKIQTLITQSLSLNRQELVFVLEEIKDFYRTSKRGVARFISR